MQVEDVVQIAEDASKLIMHYYASGDFEVKLKSDQSPVTEADLVAHKLISEKLRRISEEPILSEEDPVPYSARCKWHRFWLVDPLDGTKDFIKRTGDFTVNIALIEGNTPVMGVVAIPAQEMVYYAFDGAYRKSVSGVEKISVSKENREPLCAVSRFHCSEETKAFLESNRITQTKGYGSALKMCKIADGELDVYPRLSPTMEWDIAAGHCILNKAGGEIISAISKNTLLYNKESLINDPFIAKRQDLDFIF